MQATNSRLQGKVVAVSAETTNDAHRNIGKIRVVSERLSSVNVRQVNFDKRDTDGQQRIAQGYAGMSKRGRIDKNKIHRAACLMHGVNQSVFGVGLKVRKIDAQAFSFTR